MTTTIKYRRTRKPKPTKKQKTKRFRPKLIPKYNIALSPASHERGEDLSKSTLTKPDAIKLSIRTAQRRQRIALRNNNKPDHYTYKKLEERLTKSLLQNLKSGKKYKKIPKWCKIISPEYQHYIESYNKKRIESLKKKPKPKPTQIEKGRKRKKLWTLKVDTILYDILKESKKREKNKKKMARKTKTKGRKKVKTLKRKSRATPTVDTQRYKGIVANMSADEKKRKRKLWKDRADTGDKATKSKARKYLAILTMSKSSLRKEKTKRKGKKSRKIRM